MREAIRDGDQASSVMMISRNQCHPIFSHLMREAIRDGDQTSSVMMISRNQCHPILFGLTFSSSNLREIASRSAGSSVWKK